MIKSLHSGNTIYMRLLKMKDSTKIELFYFDDNFRRIVQFFLAYTLNKGIFLDDVMKLNVFFGQLG